MKRREFISLTPIMLTRHGELHSRGRQRGLTVSPAGVRCVRLRHNMSYKHNCGIA